MHASGKQHHGWKLDDERRKRTVTSSMQPSPVTTFNDMPEIYTHEQTETGTDYPNLCLSVRLSLPRRD